MLYLDNAATSLIKPPQVYAAMAYHTITSSANAGRGAYSASLRASELIYSTAELLCELFNISDPLRIAFAPNATLALNMAVLGVMKNGGHAVITQMEHNSLLRPVCSCCEYTIVGADMLGRVRAEDIEGAIRSDTRLIGITHASNVCGTIEPIRAIGELARRRGIVFLVDAAQTAGCERIDVEEMNIDILAFSGHKGLLGPLGTGGIYVREGVEIEPIITGGTGSMSKSITQPRIMPDMLQCGTQNAPAIGALGAGVKYILSRGVEDIASSERYAASRLYSELKSMSGITVYGLHSAGRNGTVCFNADGVDPVELSRILAEDFGVITRAGYHCAYGAHTAIGSGECGAVRMSFGAFNKSGDSVRAAEAVRRAVREARK